MATSLETFGGGAEIVAHVTWGGAGEPAGELDAVVSRIGRRTLDLCPTGGPGALAGWSERRALWVELELATGARIRPLVEIVALGAGRASVRYRHLFPDHRAALEAAVR
jgi:hypothetical protein